jgi:hypothetical protein
MANALFVDALKGYEFFYLRRGKATLDEINNHLMQEGRHPIARRTYTHYWHLLRHGFRTYLPINKFDVYAAIGRLQIVADRRNYSRIPANTPLKISRDGNKWVDGFTIDKSLVGFGVKTNVRFPVSKLTTGWIKIEGYKDIPIVFIWREHEEGSTTIGVRSLTFIDNFRLSQDVLRQERLLGTLRISREKEGPIEWVSLYGILSKTDELLRAITDLIFTFEDALQIDIFISQPVLKSIEFGSPGSFELKLDAGVSDILRTLFEFMKEIRVWGLQKRKFAAEVEGQELNNSKLKIELMRNVINLGKEVQESHLTPEIASALKKLIPALLNQKSLHEFFAPDSPEMGILQERILPIAAEIVAGDDPEYKLEIPPNADDADKNE